MGFTGFDPKSSACWREAVGRKPGEVLTKALAAVEKSAKGAKAATGGKGASRSRATSGRRFLRRGPPIIPAQNCCG